MLNSCLHVVLQVRVTREHNEECRRLLKLMGVPVLEAPGEAEAQCAQLCKDKLVSMGVWKMLVHQAGL